MTFGSAGSQYSTESPVKDSNDVRLPFAQFKADAFHEFFMSTNSIGLDAKDKKRKPNLHVVNKFIRNGQPNPLNPPFTLVELHSGFTKLKGTSTGQDHNRMLSHLSQKNFMSVLYLFNFCFLCDFSSNEWKISLIIPLLKHHSDPSCGKFYKPIFLTSCPA